MKLGVCCIVKKKEKKMKKKTFFKCFYFLAGNEIRLLPVLFFTTHDRLAI